MCSAAPRDLTEAIDEVLAVDPDSLSDLELARLTLEIDADTARLAAAQAKLLAALDARRTWAADGSRSCTAFVARKRHRSRKHVGGLLKLGRTLRHMASTDAALSSGQIAVEHALELARCARFAPAEFADYEDTLVGHARELSWEDFVRVVSAWINAVDATKAERDADRAAEGRHLVLDRKTDGTLVIQSGQLDPIGAEAFLNELERLEQELFDADLAAAKAEHGAEHGDEVPLSLLGRTAAQRRADALVEMAYRSRTTPADGHRPEPLVSVYVDYQTVAGRLCELASGVQLTAKQLLPIFTEADVERVVFGPGNRVIELGLRERFFTGGLRHAIELRDRHCQVPGCTVRASRCHVDHIFDHGLGGYTTEENGRLLCRAHNLARNRRRRGDPLVDPLTGDEIEHPDDIAEMTARIRQRVIDLRLAGPPRFTAA